MASVTVRDVDDDVHAELRRIAAQHGRSMQAELLTGVSTMPEGRRRNTVGQAVEEFLASLSGRIWSFDEPAAVEYAAIVAERRADGHPIGVVDAQIAAIARSRSASVATRDVDGLRCAGLDLVDPWRFGSG